MVNKPSEFNIYRKVESKPKFEIAGADSLNIRTCKYYWELVIAKFELKILLNFQDWKKIIKKEPSDLDKRKK